MEERDKLRAFLASMDLTQAQFAGHISVSTAALAQWLSGSRGVPGPVMAYINLLLSLPASMQQRELYLAKERSFSMEGMYQVRYQGAGEGHATMTFANGRAFGFDQMGGIYDGYYTKNEQGFFDVEISVKMPANVPSVVDNVSHPFDWTLLIRTAVTNPDYEIVNVLTNLGPNIVAEIRRMRPLPLDSVPSSRDAVVAALMRRGGSIDTDLGR